MRSWVYAVVVLAFVATGFFIGLAVSLLDNAIAVAGSAALAGSIGVLAVLLMLWRIESHLHQHTKILMYMARQRKTD
jgi:hypothetical protein